MKALDLFAGPGGWDVACAELGIDSLGIELDEDAVATRFAAGHRTLAGDVAALEPRDARWFAPIIDLLIGSPPCQTFSAAGGRAGARDLSAIEAVLDGFARGVDLRAEAVVSDPRSLLVTEPLRWALELRPRVIALEQVPSVAPIWRAIAYRLEQVGYRTWVGELNAADYGVPQVRRRAILMASLDGPVLPPEPTHDERGPIFTLDGRELAGWVTMADALGWGMTARPYLTVAGSTGTPGKHVVGGSEARRAIEAEEAAGRWLPVAINTGRDWQKGGNREDVLEPAPTIVGKTRAMWVYERPATTVAGDPRIAQPGHKREATSPDAPGRMEGAERVDIHEAAALQAFPPGYPFQGNRTAQFRQIGDAVPPPLARAILEQLTPYESAGAA